MSLLSCFSGRLKWLSLGHGVRKWQCHPSNQSVKFKAFQGGGGNEDEDESWGGLAAEPWAFLLDGLIQDSDFAYPWASFTLGSRAQLQGTHLRGIHCQCGNQLPVSSRWYGSRQSGLHKDGKVSVGGGAWQQENARKGCWDVTGMNWRCRKGQTAAGKDGGWVCQEGREKVTLVLGSFRDSHLGEHSIP